jgi:hypothetical protein
MWDGVQFIAKWTEPWRFFQAVNFKSEKACVNETEKDEYKYRDKIISGALGPESCRRSCSSQH